MTKLLVFITLVALPVVSKAAVTSVKAACANAELPVIELGYRDTVSNTKLAKSFKGNSSPVSKILVEAYSTGLSNGETKFKSAVDRFHKLSKKKSRDAADFTRWASEIERTKNSKAFAADFLRIYKKYVQASAFGLEHFLAINNPRVSSSDLIAASEQAAIEEVYGAVARYSPTANGKFNLSIIISTNESEPIPYLIPLVAHELIHMKNYERKIELFDKDTEKYIEEQFIEEAVAYNEQMKVYTELAKKYPSLFCDWLYVTWSYGDLLVPLSWTMASMEKDLRSGEFMRRYARTGTYADKPYLLNPMKTDLAPAIKEKIRELKLEYVK